MALSMSAEMFFAPAVSNIAAWLRLSDDVAGATLLAFGNGAPDFFTQVAAITHGKSVDLPLALGEGVGAGMYVCCFCLAVSVLSVPNGAPIAVPAGPFIRDVVAYLGGFLIFLWAARDLTINILVRTAAAQQLSFPAALTCLAMRACTLQESFMFIGWYALYVAVVLFGGRYVPALVTVYVDHAPHEAAPGGAGRERAAAAAAAARAGRTWKWRRCRRGGCRGAGKGGRRRRVTWHASARGGPCPQARSAWRSARA